MLSEREVSDRIGVCSWSFNMSLDRVAEEMQRMSVTRVNLAMQPFLAGDRHGASEGAAAQARALARVRSGEWKVTATMISFPHEDYTSPETLCKTGGVVPDAFWPSVRAMVEKAAKLTGDLQVPYMLMHAGHLDWREERSASKFVSRVSELRDVCADAGVVLLLETGLETVDELLRLLPMVDGVGVNFDPANMIDGHVGDPLEALVKLFPWIRHVHIKDAVSPDKEGVWGREVPWGSGEVRSELLLARLMSLGYSGDFAVEREAGDDRVGDIGRAVCQLRDSLLRIGGLSPTW